ncbi:hypothetical protein VNO80_04718 [Phaseolus coccineus]|uniref:Uncharacterized protein n=1 Tax=Phaseolus coccineus TaxID=3886 RepID=A0AAN9RPJ1_PHACN
MSAEEIHSDPVWSNSCGIELKWIPESNVEGIGTHDDARGSFKTLVENGTIQSRPWEAKLRVILLFRSATRINFLDAILIQILPHVPR